MTITILISLLGQSAGICFFASEVGSSTRVPFPAAESLARGRELAWRKEFCFLSCRLPSTQLEVETQVEVEDCPTGLEGTARKFKAAFGVGVGVLEAVFLESAALRGVLGVFLEGFGRLQAIAGAWRGVEDWVWAEVVGFFL